MPGLKGVKSMLKDRKGEEDIKANLFFHTTRLLCAKVAMCVKVRESLLLGAKRKSLKTRRESRFPTSIQLWRHSISDICPFSQNNNEVFCVLTT